MTQQKMTFMKFDAFSSVMKGGDRCFAAIVYEFQKNNNKILYLTFPNFILQHRIELTHQNIVNSQTTISQKNVWLFFFQQHYTRRHTPSSPCNNWSENNHNVTRYVHFHLRKTNSQKSHIGYIVYDSTLLPAAALLSM